MPNNNTTITATTIPSIKRRLISMVYEALLALAVLFIPLFIFEIATQGGHSPVVEHMRQSLAFLVLGAYFIHQWSRDGQTLAMKTWRLKLVKPGQARVPLRVAAARYLLAWMWFLPALLATAAFGLKAWAALGMVAAGIAAWALTALFDKDKQFLHDKLLGTRLVELPAVKKKTATA
jgi:uncharacterized RDD family membrane protein YckC